MRDKSGRTALIEAISNGQDDIIHALLSKGADPSMKDKSGRTALMIAANSGYTEIVELLRKAGATK